MDRYVGQHLVDMSTDSSYLITTWLAQLREHQSAAWAEVGRGFKPWLDQYSGSLNNLEESAAFVMTSANG